MEMQVLKTNQTYDCLIINGKRELIHFSLYHNQIDSIDRFQLVGNCILRIIGSQTTIKTLIYKEGQD